MKNKLQPTRTSFSRNFQYKKAPRWLSKFFQVQKCIEQKRAKNKWKNETFSLKGLSPSSMNKCSSMKSAIEIPMMLKMEAKVRNYEYYKVSANTASWFSQCYEKSDGSQDARRGSPDARYTKLTVRPIAFRICATCYRQKSTVWPGKLISSKKTPKNSVFGGKKSASPHFGKIWRPNCWHQVNFWGTPEKFGV